MFQQRKTTKIAKIAKIIKTSITTFILSICSLVMIQTSYANVAANQIHSLLKPKVTQQQSQLENPKNIRELKDLQSDYFFVFFYRSTCPHCHRFAPILKDFANYYHIKIVAYSTDGGDLDGLHGQRMTADEYRQYFLQGGFKAAVPALYLQNKYTDQVYPVLFGEAQPYELAQRMSELMKHIEEQPHV